MTYAFKKDAKILENNDFYDLFNKTKTIDVLFLMTGLPVNTMTFPLSGSQSHVATALATELAVKELSKKFPQFFEEE